MFGRRLQFYFQQLTFDHFELLLLKPAANISASSGFVETNRHSIHAGPFKRAGVHIYLSASSGGALY
jgi:hypothetical protein